jgi:hypothetical protein
MSSLGHAECTRAESGMAVLEAKTYIATGEFVAFPSNHLGIKNHSHQNLSVLHIKPVPD